MLLYAEETGRILGACFEVYRQKGCGFLEAVYHECLCIEFRHREIPFEHEPRLQLAYRGEPLTQFYSPDFVCFGRVVLEIKALREIADEHRAQILNYLKASGCRVGLLVNFGHYPKAQHERFVL